MFRQKVKMLLRPHKFVKSETQSAVSAFSFHRKPESPALDYLDFIRYKELPRPGW